MSFNQSVLLPVSPDEAFALVTEPERHPPLARRLGVHRPPRRR